MYVFLKFSNECKFYKKTKTKFAYFQLAFYIQLNVDTYLIVILFLNKQKDHEVYLFSKIKIFKFNISGWGISTVDNFFLNAQDSMSKHRFSVLSNNNKFILNVSENRHY